MGRHIVFKCPQTGMNVQHWFEAVPEANESKHTHVSVPCPACTKLHFVNRATGTLLGDKRN